MRLLWLRCLTAVLMGMVSLLVLGVRAQEAPVPEWSLSRLPGLVSGAFELDAACSIEGATVLYTEDGSTPTLESAPWLGSLSVDETVLLRWVAVVEGAIVARQGAAYLFVDDSLVDFSSNLPLVVVDSFGVDINSEGLADSRGPKRPVWSVFLSKEGEEQRASLTGAVDFSGRAGMRVRGQSSTMFPKKQYTLELWDEEDDDLDASLLGFPEESDWILHAPYSDKTHMRNVLAYAWFREMGHYAVGTQYVELFYNDDGDTLSMEDYAGVYVLMEKIKRDEGRVKIAKLDETMNAAPEIDGGYIIKKDKGTRNDVHFRTPRWHQFGFVEPDEPSEPQFDYLSNYLADFEDVLYGDGFADSESGYAAFINVPSFIDVHVHVEICRNIDGFRLSTYYHKDRGGKISMGPVWDYNLSLGNATMRDGQFPEGWYHHTINDDDYTYFSRLFEDRNFEIQHWDRYYQLRQTLFSKKALTEQMEVLKEELSEGLGRNFQRWPILGEAVWQNPEEVWERQTHGDEVAWLQDWLFRRLSWLDEQFTPPPIVQQGETVSLKLASVGKRLGNAQLYYTTDGSDPRASDGQPSGVARAARNGAALSGRAGDFLRARAYDGTAWSALASATLKKDSVAAPESRAQGLWILAALGLLALLLCLWARGRRQRGAS